MKRLQDLGLIATRPTRTQMAFGSLDMFRFFIVPCAADYYDRRGFGFAFHSLLRFCDDPASMVDPTGMLGDREVIIGHLMQVVHADPIYDLQLLCAHDEGLDLLVSELEAMVAGTHPRAESIGAIVEEPDYHVRLLEMARMFRRDPTHAPSLPRINVVQDPQFAELARTFGSLPTVMDYFARMPRGPWRGLVRALRIRSFPGPDGGTTLLRARREARIERRRRRRRRFLELVGVDG
jgi:hypothetical protein